MYFSFLCDLPKYDLFLSQVVDYLNHTFSDEKITNNIVQNYVKLEVITKPENSKKKGYTKTHLIQLILINYMKSLLTTEEIKKVFKLAFNEINNNYDDILSCEETYKNLLLVLSLITEASIPKRIIKKIINDYSKYEKYS